MKSKNKQIILLVLLDIIAAITLFGLFYSVIEGEGIQRHIGKYVLLFLMITLTMQFIYILINCIKSILKRNWRGLFAWVLFGFLLGCLIYGVAFVAMVYFGMLGNTLEGF